MFMIQATSFNQSQRQLQTALITLLSDSSLETISITKLCKEANVSRMAYYRHYTSIQTLYKEMIECFLYNYLQESFILFEKNDWQTFWFTFYSYLYQHQDTVRIIMKENQHSIVLQILNQIFNPKRHYHIQGTIGLTFNIIILWIENNFNLSPKKLSDISQELITLEYEHYQKLS